MEKKHLLSNFRVHSHFETPYQRAFFFTFIVLSLSSRFLKFALLGRPAYSSKHSWQNGSACGRIIFRAPLWLLYRQNSCLAWQRAAHIHKTALRCNTVCEALCRILACVYFAAFVSSTCILHSRRRGREDVKSF